MKALLTIFCCFCILSSSAYAETEYETINKCLADLSSKDVKVRRRAVLILCKFANSSVYSQLVPLLDDPDDKVRQSVVVGFIESRMVLRPATLPLLRRMSDSNVHTRRMVSSALLPQLFFYISYGKKLSKGDREILLGALKDKDAIVRKNMLASYHSLRRILGDASFFHLLGDESSEIRLAALDKLASSLSYKVLKPYLEKLVNDKSVKIRAQTLKIIGRFGREGQVYLKVLAEDKDSSIAARAMSYTRNVEYLPRLKKIILDDGTASDLVIDITSVIVNWNQESGLFVKSLLNHADESRRFAALSAMSRTGGGLELAKLMGLVKDDSSRLRKLVFRYLIRLKLSEKNISELALSDYTDVRQFTLDFILRSYRQNKAILEALYDLMLDEELKIRVAAIKAIWQCRTEDRYEILEQSLTDDEPEVRNLAAQLLLSSSDPKAQKIMKAFMKENKKVNISYLQELNTISELQTEIRAKKNGWRQKVIAALNHKNLKMKKAAIDIIVSNRDAELVSELQKFLRTNRDTELKNYLYRKISQEKN